jgi:hypothetical protein
MWFSAELLASLPVSSDSGYIRLRNAKNFAWRAHNETTGAILALKKIYNSGFPIPQRDILA